MWTFYVYPEGVAREAGDYINEDEAKEASFKVLLIWEANGCTYGPIAAITKQTLYVGP